MISVFKMEPHVVVRTNLVAASVMGTFGSIGHAMVHEVDYLTLAVMGPTAMIGAALGARFAGRFSPGRLKVIIGFVLMAVALFMFLRVGCPDRCKLTVGSSVELVEDCFIDSLLKCYRFKHGSCHGNQEMIKDLE